MSSSRLFTHFLVTANHYDTIFYSAQLAVTVAKAALADAKVSHDDAAIALAEAHLLRCRQHCKDIVSELGHLMNHVKEVDKNTALHALDPPLVEAIGPDDVLDPDDAIDPDDAALVEAADANSVA